MTNEAKPKDEYLGDGVYVSCDGYHIILDLRAQSDGEHICRIALEPPVLDGLTAYMAYCKGFYAKKEG